MRPGVGMSSPLLGVYDDRTDVLREMEHWLGSRHAVQTVFTSWNEDAIDGLFGRILPRIRQAGRVPMVTWEPFTPTPETTNADIAARIAAGEFDGYLDEWTNRLVDWLAGPDGELRTDDDRRLYLRFAHEMNGDWYPWSPATGGESVDSTPTDYIEMWRHVHDRIEREGVSRNRLQWVWCVNHVDVGSHSAEELYPGDGYVDWVGVDGFNWGTSREWSAWRSPHETFSGMFDRLERLTDKPRCVPEVASSSLTAAGHDPERKAAWIRKAFAYLHSRVQLCCWFNEDKETDWAVFGGERGTDRTDGGVPTYESYREAVADIGGSKSAKSGVVSDEVFRGER